MRRPLVIAVLDEMNRYGLPQRYANNPLMSVMDGIAEERLEVRRNLLGRRLVLTDLVFRRGIAPSTNDDPPSHRLAPVLIPALGVGRPRDRRPRRRGGEHLPAHRSHACVREVRG